MLYVDSPHVSWLGANFRSTGRGRMEALVLLALLRLLWSMRWGSSRHNTTKAPLGWHRART